MTVSYILFLDEGGNTGANLTDTEQPVFVLGGWFLREDNELSFQGIYDELAVKHHIDSAEPKGSRLARFSRGQNFVIEIIERIGRSGGIPFVFFAEKRFCIAGKMVETYLDPFYNDSAYWLDSGDACERQQIANVLYRLPSDVLKAFALSFRKLDLPLAKECGERCSRLIRILGDDKLAASILYGLPTLKRQFEAERRSRAELRGIDSVNLAMFVGALHSAETLCPEPFSVVHDGIGEFEPILKWSHQIYANAKPAKLILNTGLTIHFSFEKLRAVSFDSSATRIGVRLADLITGALTTYTKACATGANISQGLARVGFSTLQFMLLAAVGAGVLAGGYVASDPFMDRLVAPIRPIIKEMT